MTSGNYKHAKYIIQNGKKVLVSPGMGNQAYWKERSKETVEEYFQKAERVEAELKRHYERALREIKKEYSAFFEKYGEEGKNALVEAKKFLTPKQQKEFLEDIEYWQEKYMNYGITDKEFSSISQTLKSRGKIRRLEELNYQIEARISEIAWKNQQSLPGLLSDAYKGSREGMRLFFDEKIGVSDWNKISERMVKTAIREPWGPPMWSDNIWVNRQWTTKKLKDHVTYGLIRGVNPKETAKLFEKVMVGFKNIKDPMLKPIGAPNDNSYFNARRLIQTETKHILTKGAHTAVTESGVKGRYKVVTVLDKRRSKICEKKEGKIIELEEASPETMSPYHPFCRSFELFEIEGIDYNVGLTAGGAEGAPEEKPVEAPRTFEFKNTNDKEMKNLFNEAFKNSPEDVRTLVGMFEDSVKIVHKPKTGSYYQRGANYINMGSKNRVIASHEFGHYIDNSIEGGFNMHSISKDKNDFTVAYKKAESSLQRSKDNIARRNSIKGIVHDKFTHKELGNKEYSDFQDIINGLTKGKVSIYYGHSDAYWKQKKGGASETFANLFALYSREKEEPAIRQIDLLNEMFPGLYDGFKSALRTFIENSV